MTAPALWTRHRKIAYGIARDYTLPGAERQDVEQEALIGLWVAARTYDPDRSSFPTFARLVIHRRLSTLVTAALRHKHAVLTNAARDDVELAGGDDPERIVVARETLARLIAAVSELTPLERLSLEAACAGRPYAHDRSVENAVARARRKLRAAA